MNLTIAEIDALPVGSIIYDRYGHSLTRREHETRPWIYTRLMDHYYADKLGTDHPRSYGPYTLHTGLTQEELDAVPVGFRIVDKDGHELTRHGDGYVYTLLLEGMGDGRPDGFPVVHLKADKWPAPFTMAPLTTEELEALPVGSKIKDVDGDELIRVAEGWKYTDSPGPGVCALPPAAPFTLVSVGPAASGDGHDAAHEEELAAIASGYGG